MRRLLTSVSLALILFPVYVLGQYRTDDVYGSLYDSEGVAALKSHVYCLSSADLKGRKAGSDGEKAAAAYMQKTLKGYGVDVISPDGGEVFGVKMPDGTVLSSCNVVGFVQGYDPKLRDRYIVVGARLDNLGTIGTMVDGTPVERICYGANGNASGLAVLLELARKVQENSIHFRRSVLFVAFGASMETFAGSWYFLNRSFSDAGRIDAMVNLDMLGTGYNGFYAYTASNADMNMLLGTVAAQLQPVVPEITASEPYPSDHRAFYSKEIPSVMFTTGRYPEHNTDRDTPSLLSYDMMEREFEYLYNFVEALADTDMEISFRSDAVPDRGASYEDVVAYYDCDQRPMFLNSADPRQFLQKWVYQYLKYPEAAVREGVQGRVLVDFIIDTDGKVTDVRVARGVSEELDAEAVKVVSASPKWKPGRVNGRKVRTAMTVSVEFRLERKGGRSGFGIRK